MPLKLNVGLSRKVGEPHFSSRGASVNLELELEAAAIDSPDRLRDQIRHLFRLAKTSIDEELGTAPRNGAQSHQNGAHAAPHNSNGRTNGAAVRRATPSQVRAIHAIARRQQLDLVPLLRQQFDVDLPDLLTVQDASTLIDDLERRTAADPAAGSQR
jgi:hypothetical protein